MPRHTRTAPAPRPERSTKSEPTSIGAGLDALLAGIGIASKDTYDSVEETVEAELSRHGHDASVLSLRYGVLTLQAANPVVARQLFYDVDIIRDVVNEALPDLKVQRVVVRSNAASQS
jgi:hypothetical protein